LLVDGVKSLQHLGEEPKTQASNFTKYAHFF
jgi:hypothetical protein